jgi:hypothetical protein
MNRLLSVAAIVVVVVLAYFGIRSRMDSRLNDRPQKPLTSSQEAPLPTDESMQAVRDALRKGTDLAACRGVVQELNSYLVQHADERPKALAPADSEFLKTHFNLDSGELKEIENPNFTALDARYLDYSFLIHDAVQALRIENLPKPQQAAAAFAWVVREIRQVPPRDNALPPEFVLRKGSGSAIERALVFVSLLDQLDIDGCMIAVPGANPDAPQIRYWAAGALADGQVYLFDPALGLPVPGLNGEGIATLAQVRSNPAILSALKMDPRKPYHVKPEECKGAELHVACVLSSLAPRMQFVQEMLGTSDRIRLYVDPMARWQHLEAAAKACGAPVRAWNLPQDPNTPIRVMRAALPVDDGGTDTRSRMLAARAQLVPWQYYPRALSELQGEPGARLQSQFALPFQFFNVEPKMPRDFMMAWLPGLMQGSNKGSEGGQRTSELIQRERLPRDLVLRGHFDEATMLLVTIDEELRRQRSLRAQPNLEADAHAWCERAIEIYGRLLNADRASKNPQMRQIPPDQVEQLKKLKELLWSQEQRPVVELILASSAEPLTGEVTYQMALCKHEQAVRAQARLGVAGRTPSAAERSAAHQLWQAAASWWGSYLEGPVPTYSGSARRGRAQALEALGQKDSAVQLLEEPCPELPAQEYIAHLYEAKQLKQNGRGPS